MSRKSCFTSLLLVGTLLFLGMALPYLDLRAQEAEAIKPEPVKIVTVDGVKLNAFFFPSPKKSSGTVIMLHPIGEGKSIKLEGWKNLAETLQKNNFSVLMFDFRGHGDSTTIDQPEEFWKYKYNLSYVRASSKERDTIEVKDYSKSMNYYLPILINDIAAAKAFLERKNDEGACNTANTVVVGAENGATLGAIWINSEWNRYKTIKNKFGQYQLDKRAEGNDIIGAVWLNIQPELGKRKVSVASILHNACKIHGMPAVFLYGDKDADAKKYNKFVVDALKTKGSKKHEGIVHAEVSNTKLSGVGLLVKSLKTDDFIAKYLAENVVSEKNNEWENRDFKSTEFVWIDSRTKIPPAAKLKNEKNFKFETYEKFIPQ